MAFRPTLAVNTGWTDHDLPRRLGSLLTNEGHVPTVPKSRRLLHAEDVRRVPAQSSSSGGEAWTDATVDTRPHPARSLAAPRDTGVESARCVTNNTGEKNEAACAGA